MQAATKSDAKQIEIAARGGNKEGILQHKGHELKDGSTGDPHFQTEGVSGHTFWGGEAGAVTVEMLEALLVPFLQLLLALRLERFMAQAPRTRIRRNTTRP